VLRVACVLKSGGDYRPEHVAALREGVGRHMRRTPYRFVCFTDNPKSVSACSEPIPLTQGWSGWWSKLEMFDGRLTGPVLFFDLDTVIVGPLDDLALGHSFTVLRNFYDLDKKISSGVMAWRVDLRGIYNKFRRAPERFMREGKSVNFWGDQGFIQKNTPVGLTFWQDLHPGKVVSFKVDCVPKVTIPAGASVVSFHGKPRPWQLDRTQQQWFGMRDASPVRT
jgi:hypothetical protein